MTTDEFQDRVIATLATLTERVDQHIKQHEASLARWRWGIGIVFTAGSFAIAILKL